MTKTVDGQLDATKYSTAHTSLREALEQWEAFKKKIKERLCKYSFLKDGLRVAALSHEDTITSLNELYGVSRYLADVLEQIHWPKYDGTNSRLSDERGVEQVARFLSGTTEFMYPEAGAEAAWRVFHNAVNMARHWKHHPSNIDLGVDLSYYFAAEADTIMEVIKRHHIGLVTEQAAGRVKSVDKKAVHEPTLFDDSTGT